MKFDHTPPMVRDVLTAEASYSGMVDLMARHAVDDNGDQMDYQTAVDELSNLTIAELHKLYAVCIQSVSKTTGRQ